MGTSASVGSSAPVLKDFSAARRASHQVNLAQLHDGLYLVGGEYNKLGAPPPLEAIVNAKQSSALRALLVDRGLNDTLCSLNDDDIATLGLAFCQATAIFIEAQELVGQTVRYVVISLGSHQQTNTKTPSQP